MELLETLVLVLFVSLLSTVALALYLFGLFECIEVKVGQSPFSLDGQQIAYKLHTGPYSKAGHAFTTMTGDLVRIGHGVSDMCQIGFFFDDPTIRKVNKLRYAAGVILPPSTDMTAQLDEAKEQLESLGYLFTELPKVDHVVYVSFPYRGFLSILIAVKRVYPVIRNYINVHKLCAHPALEIYTADQIHFILPLSKQDNFYLIEDDDTDDDSISGDCDLLDSDVASDSDRCSNSEAEHEDEVNLIKAKYLSKQSRKKRHSCPCETPDSSVERPHNPLHVPPSCHDAIYSSTCNESTTSITCANIPPTSDLTPSPPNSSDSKISITVDRKLSSSTQGSNSSFEEISGTEIASIR